MTEAIGPPTPYDPELVEGLDLIVSVMKDFEGIDLQGRRAATAALTGDLKPTVPDGYVLQHQLVPSLDGSPEIPLLIFRPATPPAPTPVIYFIHGGGMWSGDAMLGLDLTLDWAGQLGVAVVSVEYRLAPECPHPGPVEDCYGGLVWTASHAGELGIDPRRVIVWGGSAGGGLSAATVLLARDRGGPSLFGQVLNCPMLDDRNNTASSRQLAGRGIWDHDANEEGWTALLGDSVGTEAVSQYAAAARATDLTRLPPTFIDVGSAETFRDEAVDYAHRIWAAGGQAELHVWSGGFHGFTGLVPDAAISKAAKEANFDWLRRRLAADDQA